MYPHQFEDEEIEFVSTSVTALLIFAPVFVLAIAAAVVVTTYNNLIK